MTNFDKRNLSINSFGSYSRLLNLAQELLWLEKVQKFNLNKNPIYNNRLNSIIDIMGRIVLYDLEKIQTKKQKRV